MVTGLTVRIATCLFLDDLRLNLTSNQPALTINQQPGPVKQYPKKTVDPAHENARPGQPVGRDGLSFCQA
jgi:hypothetical protein